MIRSISCISALLCAFLFSKAYASDVTFAFEGEVTSYLAASGSTMAALPLGSLVSGSYTFDPNTSDTVVSSSKGMYDNALTELNFSVAGGATVVLAANPVENFISVSDGAEDAYLVTANVAGMVAPGIDSTVFSIQLIPGSSPSAIISDALPLTPPSLNDFPNSFESNVFVLNDTEVVQFTLTSLTLIPEPASLALLSLAVVGYVATARRRR